MALRTQLLLVNQRLLTTDLLRAAAAGLPGPHQLALQGRDLLIQVRFPAGGTVHLALLGSELLAQLFNVLRATKDKS